MKCNSCGFENGGLSAQLANKVCGGEMINSANPASVTTLKKYKCLLKIALFPMILMLCLPLLTSCSIPFLSQSAQIESSGLFTYRKNNIAVVPTPEDEWQVVYNLSLVKMPSGPIEASNVLISMSYDGNRAAIRFDDALYCVNKKNMVKVTSDAVRSAISGDGSVICYVDSSDTLFTYTVSSKKKTKIAQDVVSNRWVVSPDGDVVLYCVDNGNLTLYASNNGKKIEIAENCVPLSCS